MTASLRCGAFVCLLSCLSALPAQNLVWAQASASGPQPRYDHCMACDSARQRVVLFGGATTASPYAADTWEWDGTGWQLRVATPSPSARGGAAMAYDSARQRIVLFGGLGATVQNETWEWDGATWSLRATLVAPSARVGHSLTYDSSRQVAVLYGGNFVGFLRDDTWEWDGVQWQQVATPIGPGPRFGHGAAYDAIRQRTVLFGGGNVGVFDDTWEWDGVTWVLRTPLHRPPGRFRLAMTYQSSRQRVVMFGGFDVGPVPPFGDTWEWDGTDWTPSAPQPSPAPRTLIAMAHDDARDEVVLFGGTDPQAFATYGDTWTLATPTLTATAVAFGAGCGTPSLQLLADPTARPVLGQTARAQLVNAPSNLVAMAAGWSDVAIGPTTLPLDLTAFGMPGCQLLHSAETLGMGLTATGPSTFVFQAALPNSPLLVGTLVFLQAYAFAPGANPPALVGANGLRWTLGNQ